MFAPVRVGIILTRADLARLGRGVGVGIRMGERRWMLEQLLGQEPRPVLEALGAEAAERAEGHAARASLLGPSAHFWASRARATARLLRALAAEEPPVEPMRVDAGVGEGS